jgi:cell division protein FtsW (lipid II flippase)
MRHVLSLVVAVLVGFLVFQVPFLFGAGSLGCSLLPWYLLMMVLLPFIKRRGEARRWISLGS